MRHRFGLDRNSPVTHSRSVMPKNAHKSRLKFCVRLRSEEQQSERVSIGISIFRRKCCSTRSNARPSHLRGEKSFRSAGRRRVERLNSAMSTESLQIRNFIDCEFVGLGSGSRSDLANAPSRSRTSSILATFRLLLASIFNVGCWMLVTEDFESARPQKIKIRNFIDGEFGKPLRSLSCRAKSPAKP